ncbi:glycosyltransferase family 2 protein [Bradyrhizobium sp. RT3b]|uniref:glycosyltransferase family 2 protein n=1 Tax=Bradyrhizobium sp. RT3b TaxID=3156334 RepID=UPI003398EA9B
MSEPLVSVVIPAYNASATINETLRSVRSQSHELLEIVVVDDGSTDNTAMVAQRHVDQDPRIRIIRQDHAGVAAARNRGWQSARADFIGFVDADDLWARTKVERELQALISGGEKTGLAYSWHVRIDANSREFCKAAPVYYAGDVLDDILTWNFVGNGSAVLVRREALQAVNGFDSQLYEAGAQGCEDLLFYCRVAERYHFAVVPEHLTGYRFLPENMSSNLPCMLRSYMLVADKMAVLHPDRAHRLDLGVQNYSITLLRVALANCKFGYFAACLTLVGRRDPLLAVKALAFKLPRDVLSWLRSGLQARLGPWRREFPEPSSCFRIGELGHERARKMAE